MLTKIKDLDKEIMLKMDDRTLFNFCQTSQSSRELCRDDIFWRNRLVLKYPRLVNDKGGRSWRRYYLYLTYWTSKLGEDFGYVSDDYRGDPVNYHMILSIGKYNLYRPYRTDILDEMFLLAAASGYVDLVRHLADEGALDYLGALSTAYGIDTIKTLIRLSEEYSDEYTPEDYRKAIEEQIGLKKEIPNYLENIGYLSKYNIFDRNQILVNVPSNRLDFQTILDRPRRGLPLSCFL